MDHAHGDGEVVSAVCGADAQSGTQEGAQFGGSSHDPSEPGFSVKWLMHSDPPWPNGKQSTYDAFIIEVGVRKDHDGGLRSYKRLQGTQDWEMAQSLGPTGGMEEGSWALLAESARTEMMLQIIVNLSNDAEFKEKLTEAETAPEEIIEKLAADTLQQIGRGLEKMVAELAREAVEQVRDGLRNQNPG